MKRNFTRILAAFALLVFMTPSMVGWGQTRTEVVAYTLDGTQTGGTNGYATESEITQNNITWMVTANTDINPWRFGGKNLSEVDRPAYTTTALTSNSTNITKVVVTNGTATATVNSMSLIVADNEDFTNIVSTVSGTWAASSTTTFERPTNADWTDKYFKIVYNVTAGSSNQYAQFVKAEFYKETGTTLQDSDLSLSPTALTFDLFDDAEAKAITISTSSTGAISVSNNAYVSTAVNGVATITVTPVAVTPEAQTITVSQAADNTYNAGEATFTVSVANSTPTYTVTYKANGGTGDDVVDTYYQGEDVTVRSNTFVYTGHAFTKWNTAANGSGMDYQPAATIENIQANVELYAQWEESTNTTYTYNFAGANNFYTDAALTTHPSSGNGNNVETIYYNDGSAFVASGTNRYFSSASSGYFMLGKTGAQISLPTFEGYKITQVIVHTSGSVSTNVQVSIVSGDNTASAAQKWATNSDFTYDIAADYQTSALSLNVTNNYNSQFTSVQLVCELDVPSTEPSISADPVEITYDATDGSIYATINNYVAGTLAANTEADWISDFTYDQAEEIFEVGFTTTVNNSAIARIATVTLTYTYGDNEIATKDVTITQAADPNAPGTENNPYTVAQAIAAIDDANGETVNGKYATGFVSNIETAYSTQYHNITFDIVDETGNEVFLRAYRCGGDEAADVQVGDSVVVYGNLYYYETGSLYEFAQGCQLISLVHPTSTEPSITVTPLEINVDAEYHQDVLTVTYTNVDPTSYTPVAIYYDAEGHETDCSWLWVELKSDKNFRYTIFANDGGARTAYFKIRCNGVYSDMVTVNQDAYVTPPTPGNWVLTSIDELTEEDVFVIVGDNGDTYAMSNDNGTSSAPAAVSVAVVDNTLSGEIGDNIQWNISSTESGYIFYPNGTTETWLYCTNTNNGVRVGVNDNNVFIIEDGYLKNFVTERYVGIYNSQDWRCYKLGTDGSFPANIVDQTFAFYKKVEEESYDLTITGYTNDSEKTGYHLIASPVTFDPNGTDMTFGDFDLYYFDQEGDSEGNEWMNWESNHFSLVPGTGYLYAKKATPDAQTYYFTLSGEPYNEFGSIPLTYNSTAQFAGWNLIGNPFGEDATLDMPFYRMNGEGSGLEAVEETNSTVYAMEGVFVNAFDQDYGVLSYANFTRAGNTSGEGGMKINLTRNRGTVIDNAIVRFDNGRQLPKFQLFENSTKLYIPQGNKDYAIVRSAAQGEMPVSFRASENGTYTIAVEAENVDMNYLHLIDNMTGADVDLLATPNYTFEARTNDYTSRFRLVFSANGIDEQTAETFAFFNGTSWTVSNTGDATLQVVDITGRIVSSETITGNATVSLNQPAGIYMLRLVNGNDVKVQKVVVR